MDITNVITYATDPMPNKTAIPHDSNVLLIGVLLSTHDVSNVNA